MDARPFAAGVALAILAVGAPVRADNSSRRDADRHLERGLSHFEHQEYARAIVEFQSGYSTEPRREFLFALAQAERLSGDCASAVIYYRRFIAHSPPEQQQQAAFAQLRRCQDALASGPGARKRSSVGRTRPPLMPPPSRPDRGERRWYHDHVGVALLGGGGVAAVVGMTLIRVSGSARDDALSAPTYGQFEGRLARARTRRGLGIAATLAGGALIGAGLHRVLLGRSPERRTGVAVAATPRGAAVAFGGEF